MGRTEGLDTIFEEEHPFRNQRAVTQGRYHETRYSLELD